MGLEMTLTIALWLGLELVGLLFGCAVEIVVMFDGPVGWGFDRCGEGFKDVPGVGIARRWLAEGLDEGEDLLLEGIREVADLFDDLGDDRGAHGLVGVVDRAILVHCWRRRHRWLEEFWVILVG
jgi:hypothetical protein